MARKQKESPEHLGLKFLLGERPITATAKAIAKVAKKIAGKK